jgi:hypothetical protein
LTTQELRLFTFIHCSAWRTTSRCRATVTGSTKSSANNSIPPQLLVAASVIVAERMGSASWISGERTTTSRAGSGCAVASSPRSLRQPLRRPPPSARGLLRQPPESLVSSYPRAPLMGCRSPRPQCLSTRRQAHQCYLTPTTTLRGYYSLSRVLTFDYAGFRQHSLSSRCFGLRLRGGSGLLGGRRGFFFRHRCRGFIPLPG